MQKYVQNTNESNLSNKLRSLHQVTNFLHMCKIKDKDLCYYCNQACETIDHLFLTAVRYNYSGKFIWTTSRVK